MMRILPSLLSLASFVEHEATDAPSRQRAEAALELALDALSHLAAPGTLLARACESALKVLHEAEAITGDASSSGSAPVPVDTLK